jgi:hypothetical protein
MAKETANWQTEFIIKPIEKQGQVYAYETELRTLDKETVTAGGIIQQAFQILREMGFSTTSNIETGNQLKAAIKAGWIESPACDVEIVQNGRGRETRYLFAGASVEELHPGRVRWYGSQIDAAFSRAVEIPDPNL